MYWGKVSTCNNLWQLDSVPHYIVGIQIFSMACAIFTLLCIDTRKNTEIKLTDSFDLFMGFIGEIKCDGR